MYQEDCCSGSGKGFFQKSDGSTVIYLSNLQVQAGRRRKIPSKTAATCIGKTVPRVQEEDVSKGVLDPHSSTKLSGVAIGGHQSQVHIEHMKLSLKVVTTSPQLIPTQLAPASSQPVATTHHVCASSNTTGIAVPKVQLTALSSPIPTSSTPPAILPDLTTVPPQFVISSAPPLPFHYQIPTGYQLPTQLSFWVTPSSGPYFCQHWACRRRPICGVFCAGKYIKM